MKRIILLILLISLVIDDICTLTTKRKRKPKPRRNDTMYYPAADRSQEMLLTELKKHVDLNKTGHALEISSGTGQHVTFFALNFPNITFQPTEINIRLIRSIDSYRGIRNVSNVLPAKYFNVSNAAKPEKWLENRMKRKKFDFVFNFGMIHFTMWDCTEGLFNVSSRGLKRNGLIFTFGPYKDNGEMTPLTKENYDYFLKVRNPNWGLRDITKELIPMAKKYGFTLIEKMNMPDNDHFLVWCKSIRKRTTE